MSPLKKIKPFARLIVSSLAAILVCLGLLLWLGFGTNFMDYGDVSNEPLGLGTEILKYSCLAAMWPMTLASWLFHETAHSILFWLFWLIITGLFWGSIIEFIFIRSARRHREMVGT